MNDQERAAIRQADVPPVMQSPAAPGAGRDTREQVRRGADHVLTPRRVGEQLDQPLMGVGVDDAEYPSSLKVATTAQPRRLA